jgi:hypothetical protein
MDFIISGVIWGVIYYVVLTKNPKGIRERLFKED